MEPATADRPARWQTPRQRRLAQQSPFQIAVGRETVPGLMAETMHPVLSSDSAVSWTATLEPFAAELPAGAGWIHALSPMRVIESLQDLVTGDGLIGAMSSGQGSITNNTKGLREVYRGSKAALNMFMRSFAARQAQTSRAFVLLAPGWIKTGLGGADAPFTIEETVPDIVDVIIAKRDRPGLECLDRFGKTVPW